MLPGIAGESTIFAGWNGAFPEKLPKLTNSYTPYGLDRALLDGRGSLHGRREQRKNIAGVCMAR